MKRRLSVLLLALLLLTAAALMLLRLRASRAEPTPEPTPAPTAAVTPPQTEESAAAETSRPEAAPTPTPEPTPEPTLDPNSPAAKAAALGLPAPPEVDVDSWALVLVNADHPLPADYEPELAYATESQCPQDARIAQALEDFAAGCQAAGLPVYCGSGYRSYYLQYTGYQAKAAEYGYEVAATIVAPPGTSEHQTGLCCDITDRLRSPLVPEVLAQTETFRWLEAHCAEYGFILRYPEDKQEITGIIYEPWHFRYVGPEAAAYMQENGLCLEEFLALYGVE